MAQDPASLDVLLVIRARVEDYPPTVNQANLLAQRGLRVGLVDLARATSNGSPLRPSISRWQAHRAWLSKTEPAPPFARRCANWLRFRRTFHTVMRACRPKVVIAYDEAACAYLQPRTGAYRAVYHFHDLTEPEGRSGLATRFSSSTVRRRSRRADLVVFPDALRAQYYRERARLPAAPAIVMNCPLRMTEPPHSALPELLSARGLSGRDAVCYLGSVGLDQGLPEAAQSMRHWPERSLFVLIGPYTPAVRDRILESAGEVNAADRVVFLGEQPHAHALALAAGGAVGLSLIQPNTRNWLYSAGAINKRFEYMALGLPQVSTGSPGVAEIIEHNQCGTCVDPYSPESIGVAVRQLLDSEAQRHRFAKNARMLHLKRYNYEQQFHEVAEWIERSCRVPAVAESAALSHA
jgi:glycosyltransferase involved in cell wall biosynthesis